MTELQPKKTAKAFVYTFVMLFFASSLISYFKYYHYYIGSFFIFLILLSIYRNYKNKELDRAVFKLTIFGILFTGILGLIVEIWGTSFGHWTYLGVPENTPIPFWVPFAWGLAYKSLYRVEKSLLPYFDTPAKKWFYAVILPAMILPTIGEIFVINFGTWVYHWHPQYLGMPPLAIFLLVVFHVGIFLAMCKICQIYSIKDPVYNAFVKIK